MSSYLNYKKRILAYSSEMKNNYKHFLIKNPDIAKFCVSFIERMPWVFRNKSEVLKTIFFRLKIPKCKICNKRLSYYAFRLIKSGKNINTCGKECAKKYLPETLKKREETTMRLYGVKNISSAQRTKDIKRQKALERYGTECVFQAPEIKQKMVKTCMEKYGVPRAAMSEEVINKVKKAAKKRTPEQRAQIRKNIQEAVKKRYLPILIERFKKYNLEFVNPEEYEGYNNIRISKKDGYLLRCTTCGSEFRRILHTGHDPATWCPLCNEGNLSGPENKLSLWLGDYFSLERNRRSIITPYELDIFIPSKNIAIEFNGIYFHSFKESNYHLKKTKLCENKNINLIHIFEDEWRYKQKQTKSIIKDILKFEKTILPFEKCEIKEISKLQAESFLNKYSLNGFRPSKFSYGLFYKNHLIFVASFATPKSMKDYKWELISFASTFNFTIDNALEHIIEHVKSIYGDSIIYYEDRRFKIIKNGQLLKETRPQFYYVKNGNRFNRLDFTKEKQREMFENFDESLSELQNMTNNGYITIYDCGKLIYKL